MFDGRGGEYEARLDRLRKDGALIAVGAHHAIERESPLAVTLAQGISRGERMDLVVQKATELGVRRIVPLITERSVVRLDARQADAKLRHWRAVAIAACEQCGRNQVPEIAAPTTLAALLPHAAPPPGTMQHAAPHVTRLVLSPRGRLGVRDLDVQDGLTLLVGPEGGLSDAEVEAALAGGFQAVQLGPRILRTETAALAALAALQHRFGDL